MNDFKKFEMSVTFSDDEELERFYNTAYNVGKDSVFENRVRTLSNNIHYDDLDVWLDLGYTEYKAGFMFFDSYREQWNFYTNNVEDVLSGTDNFYETMRKVNDYLYEKFS